MTTITLEIPDGKRAEWINGILTLVDEAPKDNRPVTERVKTFEDALAELGDEHPLVKSYLATVDTADSNLIAYAKLRVIAAALNEGWQPTRGEYRWYPWFLIYTQEEIDKMEEDEKAELVRFGGAATSGSQSGLGFSSSYLAFSYASASCGSRLAVKSEELSDYFGKQFVDIWKDFLIDE